jgi:hypothetical protein
MVGEKQHVLRVMEVIYVIIKNNAASVSSAPPPLPVSIANPSQLLVHDGNPIAFVATVCYILMQKFRENIN